MTDKFETEIVECPTCHDRFWVDVDLQSGYTPMMNCLRCNAIVNVFAGAQNVLLEKPQQQEAE